MIDASVVNFGDCPAEDSETLHNGTARVFSSLIHAMQVAIDQTSERQSQFSLQWEPLWKTPWWFSGCATTDAGDLRAESQPGQGSTFTLTLAQHAALVG